MAAAMACSAKQILRESGLKSLFFIIILLTGSVEGEEVFDQKPSTPSEKPLQAEQGVRFAEILAAPEKFHAQEVAVTGRVISGMAFEFVGEQPYQLEQNGRHLWVITTALPPEEDSWVTVHGKIMSPYQVKGRHYETALVETTRSE